MSIGVAIIGSGIFAKEEHLPAIQASPNLTLKAVYSRSLKSAQAFGEAAAAPLELYSDDAGVGKTYHDLLLREDIHAVVIALAIPIQPQFIEAALLAGKHVISEKPIAPDIKGAERLISFYNEKIDKKRATWAIAENFRYMESFAFGAREVERLGRVLGFRVKMFTMVNMGTKYFETAWRKKPAYQGGFLLDGGVHFIAAIRQLLGSAALPTSVVAHTSLLQQHLPPVDTVDSVWTTKSGATGTFSVSFGTTFAPGGEYAIACERGTVTVTRGKVTVEENKETKVSEFPDERSGVKPEIIAWAESIVAGQANEAQSPEQALADLEILEKLLKSGESKGKVEILQHQI